MNISANRSIFKSVNLVTLYAVYILILVGGIVRSVGAGMGCPDWPKCFGQYFPPSSVETLPSNYQEVYADKRIEKNKRLANVLNSLGFKSLSAQVMDNPEVRMKTKFSPLKARVEYINRIIGVLIGIFIIINFWYSLKLRKINYWIPLNGALALVLVIFQGWVGSLVVSTNLLPGFITFHMLLALLLVAILLIQRFLIVGSNRVYGSSWIVSVLLFLTLVQIILGTGVREQVDALNASGLSRLEWIPSLGIKFYVHRSFSILVLVLSVLLIYKHWNRARNNQLLILIGGVVLMEILLGVILSYGGMPPFAQPLHLLLGTISFGALFYLFLEQNFKIEIT